MIAGIRWTEERDRRRVQRARNVHETGVGIDVQGRVLDDPRRFVERCAVDKVDVHTGNVAALARTNLHDREIRMSCLQLGDETLPVLHRPTLRRRAGRNVERVVESVV